jgi:fructose-specific component phosphotransferase system IIB-like protein
MKTLLKIDGSLGQACGHLVKKLLVAAAPNWSFGWASASQPMPG